MIEDGVEIRVEDQYQLPLFARPTNGRFIRLEDWLSDNSKRVEEYLTIYGAILFRDFDTQEVNAFERIVRSLFKEPLEYVYRSTPRTAVGDRIYTATEFPSRQIIQLHNENSYQHDWPMRLIFYCEHPANEGGETTLAINSKVTTRIEPSIREKFQKKKILYVRNYSIGLDLPWQTVFQTDTQEIVERFCCNNQILYEWKKDGGLRTSQVSQAIAQHPNKSLEVWFNQAHLFHISSLDKDLRTDLETIFDEADLPRNAYYGDGDRIEEEILGHIREAYEAEKVLLSWQYGDVLLLDNMLISHGRMPYIGKRNVLVSMGLPYSSCQ